MYGNSGIGVVDPCSPAFDGTFREQNRTLRGVTNLLTGWRVRGNWDARQTNVPQTSAKSSGVIRVSKSEWGEKRECSECGARFYDLKRSPVICPKCEAPFVVKVEKPAPAPPPPVPTPVEKPKAAPSDGDEGAASNKNDDETDGLAQIADADDADDADDDDDKLIDDAAELDDDDMSDVLDGAVDSNKASE